MVPRSIGGENRRRQEIARQEFNRRHLRKDGFIPGLVTKFISMAL
jgi:hypothetical protein